MKSVDLAVSEDEVVLQCAKLCAGKNTRVFLPERVDVECVSAKFSKKSATLTIGLTRLITGSQSVQSAAGGSTKRDGGAVQDAFDAACEKDPLEAKEAANTAELMKNMEFMMGSMDGLPGGAGGKSTPDMKKMMETMQSNPDMLKAAQDMMEGMS